MKRRKIGPSETTPAAQPRFRDMGAVLKKPIVLLAIVMLLGIGVRYRAWSDIYKYRNINKTVTQSHR